MVEDRLKKTFFVRSGILIVFLFFISFHGWHVLYSGIWTLDAVLVVLVS